MKKPYSSQHVRVNVLLTEEKAKTKTKVCKIVLPLFSLAVLFVFVSDVFAESGHLIINEIQYEDADSSKHDFIEIYNPTSDDIDLGNYNLSKITSSGKIYAIKNPIAAKGTLLEPSEFYVWASNADVGFPDSIDAKARTSESLSSSNAIAIISRNDGSVVDGVAWGNMDCEKIQYCESGSFKESFSEKSIGRIDGKDTDDNYKDFFLLDDASPGEKNKKYAEPDPVDYSYADGIAITEILPNPQDGQDEFIELYNPTDTRILLKGWQLRDASKNGKYEFQAEEQIDSEKFLILSKSKFKFALNNGGSESVILLDPNGDEMSRTNYNGSKKGISYSFNGESWHWTKYLTPGEENRFENIPRGTVRLSKNIYKDAWANFEIKGLSKKAKIAWNFGDGHKSYKIVTRHRYEKTGKYQASVKFSQGSEDVVKNFTIKVTKMPHPEVEIVSINPNPSGKDSDFETITIKNKSKKEINLLGWSLATGWDKLINHPIKFDLEIKPKKENVLTREHSSFSLNNKKLKLELRYPDGKVAYKVKYKNDKNIEEGMVYEKTDVKWKWNTIKEKKDSKNQVIIISHDIKSEDVGKKSDYSREDIFSLAKKNDLRMNFPSKVPENPVVLGANSLWVDETGIYRFIYENPEEKHYATAFLKNAYMVINFKITMLLNLFMY